jgi:hypothetical protein
MAERDRFSARFFTVWWQALQPWRSNWQLIGSMFSGSRIRRQQAVGIFCGLASP